MRDTVGRDYFVKKAAGFFPAVFSHTAVLYKKARGAFCHRGPFLYLENHSLGEWFQKRLLPEDVQRKTPFARIGVRSGNCTKKQREAIRDE